MFLLKRTFISPKSIVPSTPIILPPPLHKRINLVIDKNVFILIAGNDFLEIELETGKTIKKDSCEPSQDAKVYDIFGVVGFLELLAGRYIIVITDRKNLGQIQDKNVYMVKRVAIIPLDYERALKTLEKHPWPVGEDDQEVVDALQDVNNVEEEEGVSHQRYISNEITETDVEEATKDFPQTPTTISSVSVSVTPPPGSPSPINKKQPVTALLSKMRSAFSDLGKRRSPSISSNGSDSDEDRGEFRSASTVSTTLNENIDTDSVDSSSDISKSPSDRLSPLSTAAKKVSEVLDGLASDYGSPKTINIKDPIDKKVMDARISKEIALVLCSDAFFFSYELDITTSLQQKYAKNFPKKELPLWKQADKRFWWNEHMLKGFIESELHSWILPIMQGYIQCEPCQIDEQKFDFILISRRSCERAGLRYQRRGINEDGAVANFVETEQILSIKIEKINHEVSFLQIRGSIPLFWSQSPYSLKPRPVLERSAKENASAFKKHFDKLIEMYGRISCINLAELSNREYIVGKAFSEAVGNLKEENDEKNIEYIEFDFHKECKGMKYENIMNLVKILNKNFAKMGYFWQTSEEEVHCQQTGIFRTNCMDCLDRTNVVQSAFAREVLNLQMLRLGISEFIDNGISHYEQFENIFNDVWANNGDSISREYAGTSALKGDFTRTGKRNFQGVVNDASNSLARMFQNTFKDFFRQATIDYILGNRSIEVFQELQQKFEASQPGDSERWAKVRATAIEISSSIVIVDSEEKMINGWTFLSPTEPNMLRGKSYEEKVLLLTKKALYVCTFHYRLEKVMQFKRIGLGEITSIEKGEYILSTLYPSCVSIEDNYGFIIYYRASGESTRINSGSMRNNSNYKDDNDSEIKKFMSFKAFRSNLVGEATKFDGGCGGIVSGEQKEQKTSQVFVNEVVEEIVKACWDIGNAEDVGFVVERPIISLEEANKSTGIMTKVGFKVKQALWL